MRRMLERISPVLLVSVAVGGFVVMSSLPATAEPAEERLDRLHPGRPVAASGNQASDARQQLEAENAQLALAAAAAEAAALEPPPPPIEEPVVEEPVVHRTTRRGPSQGSCGGDVDCFLACTRAHESDSSGGYGAVSSGGTYRGAYQFLQSTWDAAVAGAGHGEYAGVPAEQVPPEVQDAAAAHLYSVSGNRPWNGRC